MDYYLEKIKCIPQYSIFRGHSDEEEKSKMFLLYPFIRAGFVLYGLTEKMKEFDIKYWRYFARFNLLLICYDLNRKFSRMDERTGNEYRLKYSCDMFLWSILASHYIPYRFIQLFTYKFYEIFKNVKEPKKLFALYIPVLLFSYILYPTFFKIGDNFSDLVFNSTYRIFVSDYTKTEKLKY